MSLKSALFTIFYSCFPTFALGAGLKIQSLWRMPTDPKEKYDPSWRLLQAHLLNFLIDHNFFMASRLIGS